MTSARTIVFRPSVGSVRRLTRRTTDFMFEDETVGAPAGQVVRFHS
jgi:hypothetical protein